MASTGLTDDADFTVSAGKTLAQDPSRPGEYREFPSNKASGKAGFTVIEPRFIGATWAAYQRAFGFGEKKLRSRM